MPITSGLTASQLSCVRQQKVLFKDISFEIQPGELLLIEGPNGSGKTSLLRLLSGLATPAFGNIFWENSDISLELQRYWQNVHWVSHQQGIKLGLTVEENIRLALVLAQVKKPVIAELLSHLQLNECRSTLASALSAGQKRRLALLRLFCIPKNIWLLDEPITALDKGIQKFFEEKLAQHLNEGGMCILSSHQSINIKPTYTLGMSPC